MPLGCLTYIQYYISFNRFMHSLKSEFACHIRENFQYEEIDLCHVSAFHGWWCKPSENVVQGNLRVLKPFGDRQKAYMHILRSWLEAEGETVEELQSQCSLETLKLQGDKSKSFTYLRENASNFSAKTKRLSLSGQMWRKSWDAKLKYDIK